MCKAESRRTAHDALVCERGARCQASIQYPLLDPVILTTPPALFKPDPHVPALEIILLQLNGARGAPHGVTARARSRQEIGNRDRPGRAVRRECFTLS